MFLTLMLSQPTPGIQIYLIIWYIANYAESLIVIPIGLPPGVGANILIFAPPVKTKNARFLSDIHKTMLLPQCTSQESITVIYVLRFSTGLISLDIPKCAKTFHYILRKIYDYI